MKLTLLSDVISCNIHVCDTSLLLCDFHILLCVLAPNGLNNDACQFGLISTACALWSNWKGRNQAVFEGNYYFKYQDLLCIEKGKRVCACSILLLLPQLNGLSVSHDSVT